MRWWQRIYIALALSGIIAVIYASSTIAAAQSGSSTSSIASFVDEPTNLVGLNASYSKWVEIPAGPTLAEGSAVSIHYTCSPTMSAKDLSLTLYVNDQPVSSCRLPIADKHDSTWTIPIKSSFLHLGWNEVRLSLHNVAAKGRCTDVDKTADWYRIQKDSKVKIVRKPADSWQLSWYPYPFLDVASSLPVHSTWYLPKEFTPEDVSGLLNTASDWGYRQKSAPLGISVAKPGSAIGSFKGHQLLFGIASHWSSAPIEVVGGKVPPSRGLIKMSSVGKLARVLVTGGQAASYAWAVDTLTDKSVMEQAVGVWSKRIALDKMPNIAKPITRSYLKLGTTTLFDLGLDNVTLAGPFTRKKRMTIYRPPLADLGKESMISVSFKHSAILRQKLSQLEVRVNDVPVGSVRLTKLNANKGLLEGRIPVSELSKPVWNIDFVAYNDLAEVDCNRSYDDVAWTWIDGASTITLKKGDVIGQAYLEGFPNFYDVNGKMPEVLSLRLPLKPTAGQLTTAARLAARVGQIGPHIVKWKVYFGGVPRDLKGPLVYLTDAYEANISSTDHLRLLEKPSPGYVLVQASRSSWDYDSVMYSIVADGENAWLRAAGLMSIPEQTSSLKAQGLLLTATGKSITVSNVDPTEMTSREATRYTVPMIIITVLAFLALVALVRWLISMFHRR